MGDDLDALVLNAEVLDYILKDINPAKKARVIEIQLMARIRKHAGNPKSKEPGARWEKIRENYGRGLLNSLDFLKSILKIAKDRIEAENQVDPEEEQDRTVASLTEFWNDVRNRNTHVIVGRLAADSDPVVRQIRFDRSQNTPSGEGEVPKALQSSCGGSNFTRARRVFEKAYGYIRQYY